MTQLVAGATLQESEAAREVLGSPFVLPCGVTLDNRLVKSALSEGLGTLRNAPSDGLIRLYDRWADSGAGLLITGNVMVDRTAVGEPGNVIVDDDRDLAALRSWAEAATRRGAEVWVQINHPGRQIPRSLSRRPVAPSAVAVADTFGTFARPRALTEVEIENLIQRYATTARTVIAAGFTGVQIHGAHGYLVSQFLSPLVNQRTDRWGGSPENRRRFLVEVVRAVRAEIGPEVPLSVKLNSADFQRGGFTEEESLDVVLALEAEGIDLLEISGGTYESAAMMGIPAQPSKETTRAREAYFLDYAEKVRVRTSVPLLLTGGFRSAAGMSDAITGGSVDLIGLGRPLALAPDFPARLLDGSVSGSSVRPRQLGIRRIDGAIELTWYAMQLRRMAAGKDPAPGAHAIAALPHLGKIFGYEALRRMVVK